MDWNQYLNIFNSVKSKKLTDKLNLFFSVNTFFFTFQNEISKINNKADGYKLKWHAFLGRNF